VLFAIDVNLRPAQSIFEPASPSAQSIVSLSILMLAVAGLIFVVVEGVLFYCVWRFRTTSSRPANEPPQAYGSHAIEIAWTAAPGLIVLFLTLVIGRTLWEVEAAVPAPRPNDRALFVTVRGHQWWWEYEYETYDNRKLGFITANELHIPLSEEGEPRPVYLTLVSADVCHSFWVPRLGGKMDAIPGRTNSLLIETDKPGLYLGQCAEYCGAQHANMMIRVYADTPEDFDRWVANQAKPSVDDPGAREGRDALLGESCVNCHTVRGTAARGTYAPDLTHLMSRETLASCEVANNLENLNDWVRDPQSIKPGCLMPAFGLSDRKRELIVEYLTTLR
jgi:cytochrome c oxidase subunit 2